MVGGGRRAGGGVLQTDLLEQGLPEATGEAETRRAGRASVGADVAVIPDGATVRAGDEDAADLEAGSAEAGGSKAPPHDAEYGSAGFSGEDGDDVISGGIARSLPSELVELVRGRPGAARHVVLYLGL